MSQRTQIVILSTTVIIFFIVVGVVIFMNQSIISNLFQLNEPQDTTPDTVTETNDTTEPEPAAEADAYIVLEPLDTLALTNEPVTFDVQAAYEGRDALVDQKHYYTLLANPEVGLDEVAVTEPPVLPEIVHYQDPSGELMFDVLMPPEAKYDISDVPEAMSYDAVTFAGITIDTLFTADANQTTKQVLDLIREDVTTIVQHIDDTYGDIVNTPVNRLHEHPETEMRQPEYTLPPHDVLELYVLEAFLTTYIDAEYSDNTVDTFLRNGILNQHYLYSDLVIAQAIAEQYVESAGPEIVTRLFSSSDVNQ